MKLPLRRLILAAVCLYASTLSLFAHTPAQEMSDAAQNLLALLAPEQKAKISFDFKDDQRTTWYFTPVIRKGLTVKEMTPPQRYLAYALLSSALSQRGFMKASTIMSLEQTLGELEGPNRPNPRDPEDYHVFIFWHSRTQGLLGLALGGPSCFPQLHHHQRRNCHRLTRLFRQ